MTLIVEHCLSAPGGDVSCQSLEATSPETAIFMTDKFCYTNVYLDSKYFFHVCNMINVFQTRGLDCSGKYHHHHHHHWFYSCGWALASSVVNIGTLFYLTTQHSSLRQFCMVASSVTLSAFQLDWRWGSHLLAECTTVNIRSLTHHI